MNSSVTKPSRRSNVAVRSCDGDLEDEVFEQAPAIGTQQGPVDHVPTLGDAARDRFESVARTRPAKSRSDGDGAPRRRQAGGEMAERALHDLERHRHTRGRVRAVVGHHVVERERDRAPTVDDLQRLRHAHLGSLFPSALHPVTNHPVGWYIVVVKAPR